MPTVERVNSGKSHWYRSVDTGLRIPGVTTLKDKGLPKPQLMKWHAEMVAAYAVDHRDELAALPPIEMYKILCKAPYAALSNAAVRGSTVHKLAHRLSLHEQVEVPDGMEGLVQSALAFLNEFDVRVRYAEVVVHSAAERGHSGQIDLLADLLFPDLAEYDVYDRDDDGYVASLLDYKTSASGIFGDVAYQLAGYRHSKWMITDEGDEIPMPPVSFTGAVHLTPDGYSLVPLATPPSVYRDFLYLKEIARMVEQSNDLRGDPIIPPYTNRYEITEVAETKGDKPNYEEVPR
jgi:hypothetical protein